MSRNLWLCVLILLGFAIPGKSQKIVYSEPDKEDNRRLEFEIAGKVNGHFLIYKKSRGKNWIAVYDNDMKELDKVEQTYFPNDDRLINTDFFAYPDHVFMIYEYQKKNIIHCMGARIDGDGHIVGEPIEIDTTQLSSGLDNKIYTAISSEDKSKIAVFKINSRNRRNFIMTSLLLNDQLQLQEKRRYEIPMEERNDYLNEFYVDNDGDLVFAKFNRGNSDNIISASLCIKKAGVDSIQYNPVTLDGIWLDEIKIKIDNYNKRYFMGAFYYKESRGNIDGLFYSFWDKSMQKFVTEGKTAFTDDQRREARGDASMKMAYNDFFIRHIILRRDGGFILGTEAYYTTSRFNNWNRWDYLYSPFYPSGIYSPYYRPYYYNNYYMYGGSNRGQSVRYHADHIAVISYNNRGEVEWHSVIAKSQWDDESDELISYQMMNTGGQLHFLFNEQERRNNLLSDYSVAPDGMITRNPTLKNLDKGYDFITRYGKQVGARVMIIPCYYLSSQVSFAKLEYN